MSVFNSLSVSVLIVLLIAGLVTGLAVAGIDLFNPNTSAAEAYQKEIETKHQENLFELQEQLEQAKTEAEIAAIKSQQKNEQQRYEAELNYTEQMYTKKLAAFDRWLDVRDILLIVSGVAISGSLFVYVTVKAVNNIFQPSPVMVKTTNSNEKPEEYWTRHREMAREIEQLSRQNEILLKRMQKLTQRSVPKKKGGDDTKYDDLPLAG
jgi:hypothetical protein